MINLKHKENDGCFLEGTGSLVFDHLYKKAYACISSRTNINLLRQVCSHLDYEPVTFEALDEKSKPIYHTNVMMWIGTTIASICLDTIHDPQTKVCKFSQNLKSNQEFRQQPLPFLEPRQYKNDSIQSKIIPTLKLPRFFTTYTVWEKSGNFKIGIIFD